MITNSDRSGSRTRNLDVERYRFITSQIQFFGRRMMVSFKTYMQMVLATVAGLVWLQAQNGIDEAKELGHIVGPAFLIVVGLFWSFQIIHEYKCWFGYRLAEHSITRGAAPKPVFPAWHEYAKVACMQLFSIGGALLFWYRTWHVPITPAVVVGVLYLVLLVVAYRVMSPARRSTDGGSYCLPANQRMQPTGGTADAQGERPDARG